jgi:hypothetical protein
MGHPHCWLCERRSELGMGAWATASEICTRGTKSDRPDDSPYKSGLYKSAPYKSLRNARPAAV